MKILIPVDFDKDLVCVSFGRAPSFAIKDTDSGKITYIDNPAASAQGGAGIKAAQAVVDSGAEVLITVRLGQNGADILKAANIKIYKSKALGTKENFTAYEQGELEPLTQFTAGYYGKR